MVGIPLAKAGKLCRGKGLLRHERRGAFEKVGQFFARVLDQEHVELHAAQLRVVELLMQGGEVEAAVGLAADRVGDVDQRDEQPVAIRQVGRMVVMPRHELAGARELPVRRQPFAQLLVVNADDLALDLAEIAAAGLGLFANGADLFGRVLPFIPPVGRKIKNGPGTMFLNSGDQVRLLGDVAGYTITERSVQKAPTGLHSFRDRKHIVSPLSKRKKEFSSDKARGTHYPDRTGKIRGVFGIALAPKIGAK